MTKKSLKLAPPKLMGYVITAISQNYKSIVTDYNTNSSTATGNETVAVKMSPYFYFRLDKNLAQSCTSNYNGIYNHIYFTNLQVDTKKL